MEVEFDLFDIIVFSVVKSVKDNVVDLVIGFGGGSFMDVVKLVVILFYFGCMQMLLDMYGVGNVKEFCLFLIQVFIIVGIGFEVMFIVIVIIGEIIKVGVVFLVL